ncbi:TPA: hypothetical protein QBP86_001878 [Pseudomonas aeruginosa]|nr:hypothetical protein [Pseudomonas aeruginosa]
MTNANECTCPSGDGSLRHPCPAHPAPVEQVGTNVGHGHVFPRADGVKMRCGGPGLCSECAADASRARAALAQPSPASDLDPFNLAPHAEAFNEAPAEALKSDQAEVERPVVIARLYRSNDLTMTPFAEVQKPLPMPRSDGTLTVEPLMTVAQHERIVGALRAEIAEWQEAAGRGRSDVVAYIAERAKLLEGRDAALARVAELERELSNEENAHTTTIEQRDNAEHWADQLANAIAERFGVDIGEHSNLNCPWNEALVWMQQLPAQAQHSVPDGYRLIRLEHFAAIKAQLNPEQVDAYRGRNIYDEDKVYANWNACRSALDEIKDVFQQIDWDAENELAELLAAAPGNSAQHSVPEGWMLVECGIWTQEQVDEMQRTVARFRSSEFVDDRALAMAVADAGQCKAPEISLAELLAAAPGKEGL